MKRILGLVGAVVFVGLLASGLKAQERLALGDPIRVSYSVLRDSRLLWEVAEGTFHGVSTDSILMVGRAPGDTLGIPIYWVDGVEVYRGRHSSNELVAMGGFAGGIAGAVSASKSEKCGNSCWFVSDAQSTGLSVLIGIFAGASAGGRWKGYSLVKVPMAHVRSWSIEPTVESRISDTLQPHDRPHWDSWDGTH